MTQLTLNQFYEGHRTGVIEKPQLQRRVYDYINKQYHKGHRYLFVFRYEGPQPIRSADAVGSWGRYGTVKQARFNYSEDKAIVFSLPHTLKIWIKHPDGSRTAKELATARRTAWQVAESFSRKYGIQILSEKSPNFSEHTVENKPLDNLMRPMVQEEPELAKKKLGLSVNQTSHKNKVEWTGKTAKERVMALEKLLDTDVLAKIETIEQGVGAIAEGQERIIRRLARPKKPKLEQSKPYDGVDYR
jgi:hypothetical protein